MSSSERSRTGQTDDHQIDAGQGDGQRIDEHAAAERPADDGPLDAADDWHRLHPLSPLIRGWVVVLAFLGILLSNFTDSIFGGRNGDGPGLGESVDGLPGWASLVEGAALWIVILVAAVVATLAAAVVVALFSLFVWWFTRYQITPTHVRLRTGAVFRQERQTRLDRVQAIDIQRPLGPRIFGLAELRFEVADAGESSVVLRYLRHASARELRSQLLSAIGQQPSQPVSGKAASGQADDAPVLPWAAPAEPRTTAAPALAEADDEQLILRVPTTRVLLSWALSPAMIALVLVGLSALVVGVLAPGVMASAFAGWLPALIGLGVSLFQRLERTWGFRAYRTSKGLRLRYGLLNAASQTVPTGRIQAVRVRRPLLWRWAGWSDVAVNVAGYGSAAETGESSGRSTLIPVATDEHLGLMLAEALGDSDAQEVHETVCHGLTADLVNDPQQRFTISPPRAARFSWVVRRRRGFAVTPREVITIDGRLTRISDIVPHGKIQSMGISRGPLDRWMDLSDVSLHSIAGPVSPTIYAMDREVAERFVEEQAERARAAHELVGEDA